MNDCDCEDSEQHQAHPKVRILRGRVVVRILDEKSKVIWTPDTLHGDRKTRTHRGRVLGMGPPALFNNKHEVEPGFRVGDIIQFHFTHHMEAATRPWVDGLDATWIPQISVDAVWDEDAN